MTCNTHRLFIAVALALACLASHQAARAQDSAPYLQPDVPLDQLPILITPLTQEELVEVADAWQQIVKEKVQELADAEVAAKQKRQDIADVEEEAEAAEVEQLAEEVEPAAAAAADDVDTDPAAEDADEAEEQTEALTEERQEILASASDLRDQRKALIDRAEVVLDELESKGGDAGAYRDYLTAVATLRVDVTDADATRAMVIGWLKSDEGGLLWARNILFFVVLIVLFIFISRVVGRMVDTMLRRAPNMTYLMRDFASKSVRRIVLGIGFIVALSALGVDIAPLLAVIGAAGFVVAFALQDTLGNLASGIMILLYRPFDVGDAVEVAGISGVVKSLNLVSVTINSFDNQVMIVPNNAVWNNNITNITGSAQRRVDMVFGIGYGDDIQTAQDILERIIKEHELTLDDPEPVVKLHELADSSVNFVVRPWAKTADYWNVYWDITRKVKEEFDANGVSIPFPQRDIHLYRAEEAEA